MDDNRRISRRSFLAQVAGGALIGCTAMTPNDAASARTPRRMTVDADPNDRARPIGTVTRSGRRRRTAARSSPSPPPPTVDADIGPSSDAAGSGGGPRERFVVCPGHRRCPR